MRESGRDLEFAPIGTGCGLFCCLAPHHLGRQKLNHFRHFREGHAPAVESSHLALLAE